MHLTLALGTEGEYNGLDGEGQSNQRFACTPDHWREAGANMARTRHANGMAPKMIQKTRFSYD
jgi:hypothetical protein